METKEQMIDYLQCDVSSFGFQDLYDLVISKNNCISCGICVSICPRLSIEENYPTLTQYDPECSLCYKYCPRTYFPEDLFENEIFKGKTKKDTLLGNYQSIYGAKTVDEDILKVAQNGGIVSSILIHALETNMIDGVLMSIRDEDWRPKPFIARTREEILSAAGSIYAIAPTLSIYNDTVYKYKIERLAFVGMPCQIQAVRKLQLSPPLSSELGIFKLVIGLFCSYNYSYELMKNMIFSLTGISMNQIGKFDVTRGKFLVYLKNNKLKEIPIKDTKKFYWSSCRYCKDYTAEFADMSIGSIGSPGDNWNSVIIRSEIGETVFNELINSKRIKYTIGLDVNMIKKASQKKKLRTTLLNDNIISLMQLLNITEQEARVYSTLLSLGKANLQMLSEVMKLNPEEIRKSINWLVQRGWVFSTNGYFRPNQPIIILKKEIKELKKSFEQKISALKSEVLNSLEDLYLQNNLNTVKSEDFSNILL
ncbi:MAG: Coenzyme F420 hydrogenase/dehydrogenase, beta subunit C-terminal domain [Candidatus Thorarchaeota archaeon]